LYNYFSFFSLKKNVHVDLPETQRENVDDSIRKLCKRTPTNTTSVLVVTDLVNYSGNDNK